MGLEGRALRRVLAHGFTIMKDFFISYTAADEAWATWVAWALEEAGYSVVLQAWDFKPGSNFVLDMHRALQEAVRIIAILTPVYLRSMYGGAEWAAGVAADPTGIDRKLIPVRVAPSEPAGLLRSFIYIDLVGLADEAQARKKLLDGLSSGRMKPEQPPPYPGSAPHRIAPNHPAFPAMSAPTAASTPPTTHYIPRLRPMVTELETRRFLRASFDDVRSYFEHGLKALKNFDARFDTEFQQLNAAFIAEVYVDGKRQCVAKVWLGAPLVPEQGIVYSEGQGADVEHDNSFQNLLTASSDEDGLHLRALMPELFGPANESIDPKRMTSEQAAQYLWQRFIHQMSPDLRAAPQDRASARSEAPDASVPVALERWREYSRSQIPPIFGQPMNPLFWSTGFVVTPKHLFLFVTLDKSAMPENARYADKFLSPSVFQWQSQNRTAQDSKHGRLLRNHAAAGVEVHLFVRAVKRSPSGATTPFTYCGPVSFESWEGERPITVIWRLAEPVPPRLHELLRVPS